MKEGLVRGVLNEILATSVTTKRRRPRLRTIPTMRELRPPPPNQQRKLLHRWQHLPRRQQPSVLRLLHRPLPHPYHLPQRLRPTTRPASSPSSACQRQAPTMPLPATVTPELHLAADHLAPTRRSRPCPRSTRTTIRSSMQPTSSSLKCPSTLTMHKAGLACSKLLRAVASQLLACSLSLHSFRATSTTITLPLATLRLRLRQVSIPAWRAISPTCRALAALDGLAWVGGREATREAAVGSEVIRPGETSSLC